MSYNRKANLTDAECGPLPKFFGTGANIRIIGPDGSVTQANPRAYHKMPKQARESLCTAILGALVVGHKHPANHTSNPAL